LNSSKPLKIPNLWMVNVTFEILLIYHIRKTCIDENFSCAVLVLYMCTLEQLKKDHLTIITAFVLKDKYLYVNLIAMCITVIRITNKWQNKQTCVKRNIRWSFECCRQTFEGYKLTFIYALVYLQEIPLVLMHAYLCHHLYYNSVMHETVIPLNNIDFSQKL